MLRSHAARSVGFNKTVFASAAQPPAGDGSIHEIKHDGFRIVARRDPNGVPGYGHARSRTHQAERAIV